MDRLGHLVSVDWLADNIGTPGIVAIDCTWILPGVDAVLPSGLIPGARAFDLGAVKALPPAEQTPQLIADMLGSLGVSYDDNVIIYDRHGLFSAPRLWWLMRSIGHERVGILNGGLPAWIAAGHNVVPLSMQGPSDTYQIQSPKAAGVNFADVMTAISTKTQIVDARPLARFLGTAPEPREGLRAGRIPGACSLPFGSLKNPDGMLPPITELRARVSAAGIDLNAPIITTCGSGVTATGLAFIFHLLGKSDVAVYSGSWAEWGASDAPIETG